MSPAISVSGLRKAYDGVEAVRGIEFEVETGEIFGLLGPNGAGKTTTVEVLEGYRARRPLTQRDLDMLPTFLLIRGMAIIGWYLQRPEIAHEGEFESVKDWVLSHPGGAATP